MSASGSNSLPRRDFLLSAAAVAGGLSVSGMAFAQSAAAVDAPVQRLLMAAARSAFAVLTAPEGFWNSRVARFGLPALFRKTPANAAGPLGNDTFREQLQHRLNNLAETGARAASPAVIDAARGLAVADPAALLRAGVTAATTQLRLDMGSGLVNAMIPALTASLTAAQDPIVAQAVAALAGVQLKDVAHSIALAADNGIWYEIGRAEAAIRANPAMANDPALAAALRG